MTTKNKGFTLIELLMYAAGMVLLLGAIAVLLSQLYALYRDLTLPPKVDRVGIALIDRIVKDIRSGSEIDLSNSSFEVPTGSIALDVPTGSGTVEKRFSLQNGRAMYQEDSGAANPLSPTSMSVSRLYFTQIVTPISEAVRVEIDISYSTKDGMKTKTYNGAAILRRSYD